MVQKNTELIQMLHYGEYEPWNRDSKKLPNLLRITHEIIARPHVEFGYTLKIRKHKGKMLRFCIDHPPFLDENGHITPSFTGDVFISSNSYHFYLGDCVWKPVHDKIGAWRLRTFIDSKCVADTTIHIVPEVDFEDNMDW